MGYKAVTAGSKASGFFSGLGRFIGNVFSLIITRWKISIPLILILTTLISTAGEAIDKKSFVPVVKNVGERFFSVNHAIYKEANRIIQDKGIYVKSSIEKKGNWFYDKIWIPIKKVLATIGSIWSLIINLVIFGWWIAILLWFAGMITNNESARLGVWLVAVVLWFALSTVYASLFIYPQLEAETGQQIPLKVKLNPFSGLFKLLDAFKYFKPIVDIIDTESNNNEIAINNSNINVDLTI